MRRSGAQLCLYFQQVWAKLTKGRAGRREGLTAKLDLHHPTLPECGDCGDSSTMPVLHALPVAEAATKFVIQ
jgi:hypothetical protein